VNATPPDPPTSPSGGSSWLAELDRIDRALYAAVAGTHTPRLDVAMRRLSSAADYSRLSLVASVILSAAYGRRGRRAAASGLVSLVATSTVVNAVVKLIGRRRRPDRAAADVPVARQVPMPSSRSFPSGHTAAAVAFASGVGRVMPVAALPLHVLAAMVGYSRVHTGVHYPGDVLAGAVLGAMIADVSAGWAAGRARTPRTAPSRRSPDRSRA
jgi:membrane-associated phospholipid phosphatase